MKGLAIFDMTVVHYPACADINNFTREKFADYWLCYMQEGLAWTRLVGGVMLFLMALAFMISVGLEIPVFAELFILVIILTALIRILHIYVSQSRLHKHPRKCEIGYVIGVDTAMFILTLISLYFCAVINSYSYILMECCSDSCKACPEEEDECTTCTRRKQSG